MTVCTYDNPATMARECWQDGKLICHYACQLLPPFAKEPIPGELFFFGASIGPWKPGQTVGDAEAIGPTGPQSYAFLESTMDRAALKQGGRYNWKGQPERLIYMGTKHYFGDRRTWHQFSLVGDDPETCWCEVLEAELLNFEETAQDAPGCNAEVVRREASERTQSSTTATGERHEQI